ncbi:cytochrome P450 monooxygenase CYP63 [Rickenella mellea]|uniref:Cytochrome P450 monooxygenase CYP63 n=1 Tax=Rickenella mellea TaxID=50990 RepID=A0A4Y7Q784_9AGAM|nr:cytochrome P450 monooxygenase CYP63 [Rickenella mellea]
MTVLRTRLPAMALTDTSYRAKLCLDLLKLFVPPLLVLSQILRISGVRLGYATIPASLLAIILWGTLRNIYYDIQQSRNAKRYGAKTIPRIKGKWPGNIDVLLRMMKAFKSAYVLDVYLELFKEYQSTALNTRIFWIDQIITMDEEHMKFILATGFNHFWRGYNQKRRFEFFLGNGIFNRDDEIWKMHRANARPFFAKERISDFQTFEKHTTRTIALLSAITASGKACDAQDLYARFSIDSASEYLFGENLDTLSKPLPFPGRAKLGPKGSATEDDWGTFVNAFEEAQSLVTHRARLGVFWPLMELFRDKGTKPSNDIKEWLDPLVQRAVEEKEKMRASGVASHIEDKTFLEHLADSTEDVDLIRDELLSILLASRDTTSCLLTFVTYFMAMYPDVAKRLRDEVLESHGTNTAPTYESLRSLKYMRAVLNETLRLFPPVPLNIRESRALPVAFPPSPQPVSDYVPTSSEPLYVPPETIVLFFPLLMQRNPDLWGEDADEFDPDRWLEPKRLARITSNPMMFTPFSAGPRICVGQNFAYNEASFFLVRLLQQFDTFTLTPEFQPEGSLPPPQWKSKTGRQAIEKCWPSNAMTLYAKGGLWVRFGKAS